MYLHIKKILPVLFFAVAVFCSIAKETDLDSLPVKVVLFPIREATLSTMIDGVISKYNFRAGDRFKKNDVLLTLDDRKYRNELDRTQSHIRECALNVEFAKKKLEDNERLFKNDLQSEIEVVRSRFDHNVALERLQSAYVNRNGAALQLHFCKINAPFDGIVEKLLTREYEMVRSGQPVLSIMDDNELLAVMNLPSKRLPHIRPGQEVTIRITENGRNVTGDVFEIAPRADHRSETFEVKVRIRNSKHIFKPGMSGVLVKIGD